MAFKPKSVVFLDRILPSPRNRSRLAARISPDEDQLHRCSLPSPPSSPPSADPTAFDEIPAPPSPPPILKLSHPLLRALESSGCAATPKFSQALAQLIVSGLVRHRLAAGRAVKALCCCPTSAPLAVALFSGVDDPDAFLSNTIIRSYIAFGRPDLAFAFFRGYVLPSRVSPNHFTFPLLAKLSAELRVARNGRSVHALAARLGFESDLYTRNSLIHMYSSLADVDSAQKLFNLDLDSDVVTRNSMVHGYIKNGMFDSARRLFDEIPDRDLFSWNVMIYGYAEVGDMDAAKDLFVNMPERDAVSWNTLIDGYARKDETEAARELFDVMPIKNLISWNIILALYSRIKGYRECLKLFDSMIAKGDVKPDEATFVSVLTACAHLGDLARGKWVHSLMLGDYGMVKPDILLLTALVNMYSKCGDMGSAEDVFNLMEERSVATWNSMIIGYGLHGNGAKALELFMQMEEEGPKPNETTFVCILSAFAHGGMVLEGWWCFDRMIRLYTIEPNADHFGCMLDLLGRAGFLRVSEKLVERMPVKPVPALWGALMSACRTHCDWKLGGIIGKRLIEMEPLEIGPYILLSNIYAANGRWDDVEKVREMIEKKCLQKGAAFSLLGFSNDVVKDKILAGKKGMLLSMLCEMGSSIKLSYTETNRRNSSII